MKRVGSECSTIADDDGCGGREGCKLMGRSDEEVGHAEQCQKEEDDDELYFRHSPVFRAL